MSREPKKKKKEPLPPEIWCEQLRLISNLGAGPNGYERCPKCNQRLKVLFLSQDNKYFPYLPKHKDKRYS